VITTFTKMLLEEEENFA